MLTADHPDVPFVQAKGFTTGRPSGPPIWLVFHDMEAGESSSRAETTAIYFADPPDERRVSSHYCVDSDSVIQCVRLKDSAWTVGNQPGNHRGINWELAGFARQSRAEWLDPFGISMFNQMKKIALRDMKKYNIPIRWLTNAQVKAMQPGMTTHNQLREVFGVTTHTDPGAGFPFDYVLELFLGGTDMPLTDVDIKKVWAEVVTDDTDQRAAGNALWMARNHAKAANDRLSGAAPIPAIQSVDDKITALSVEVTELANKVDRILAALTGGIPVSAEVKLSAEGVQQVEDAIDRQIDQINLAD